MPPEMSVVVPARNAGASLSELIEALAVQTLACDRFDVLVADDGSTDGSIEAIESRGDAWLSVTHGQPANSYAARNRAARLARAPLLAFCDADCTPEPEWLERGLAALQRANLVAGLVRFDVPGRRSLWSLLDVDMNLDQERAVRSGRAATANLFVRRALFEQVGGFDDSLPNSSDFDFVGRCLTSGAALVYEPRAVVRHPTRNEACSLFGKVWAVNVRYAVREARHGRRPAALRLREWVPVVQTLRSRRRFGRSLRLDRARLHASGVHPRLLEDVLALPFIYVVVPYVRGVAQLRGWHLGRA